MLKACYSPKYYATTHTNSMEKLTAVAHELQIKNIAELIEPKLIDIGILKNLHAPEYVEAFINGTKPLATMQGFRNWNPQLRDAILAVQAGQLLAAEIAWQEGIASNIAQGFHHAIYEFGSSYCTFNGLALIAQQYPDRKIFVLDCDQHGGNGTGEFTLRLPNLFNFSIFGHRFGCISSERSMTYYIDQKNGTLAEYLEAVDEGMQMAKTWGADLIIYQAGMDCHQADRFGSSWLTKDMLFERDLYVFERTKQLNIPIMFVLAGGYQKLSDLVPLHVATFEAANQVFFPA